MRRPCLPASTSASFRRLLSKPTPPPQSLLFLPLPSPLNCENPVCKRVWTDCSGGYYLTKMNRRIDICDLSFMHLSHGQHRAKRLHESIIDRKTLKCNKRPIRNNSEASSVLFWTKWDKNHFFDWSHLVEEVERRYPEADRCLPSSSEPLGGVFQKYVFFGHHIQN